MSESKQHRWTRRPEGSNWGDFGPDDQIGRLNLITPERRLAAVREVREGRAFPLSLPLDYPGGESPEAPRQGPRHVASSLAGNRLFNFPLTETDICCDDAVTLSLQYSTQWDSLAHWGRMFDIDGSGTPQAVYYNGFRAGVDVLGPDPSGKLREIPLGIDRMATTGVQGRGVLVNLVKCFGRGRSLIGYDHLMRAIDAQKVEVRTGDFLVLYTGYGDAVMAMAGSPDEEVLQTTGAVLDGSDDRLLDWIDSSGVAALAADNAAVEIFDPALKQCGAHGLLPLHDRCLFKLGIHLGELWWLGDLAAYLDEAGRHAFLLTAPPLRLPGAAGSPVTPVATV